MCSAISTVPVKAVAAARTAGARRMFVLGCCRATMAAVRVACEKTRGVGSPAGRMELHGSLEGTHEPGGISVRTSCAPVAHQEHPESLVLKRTSGQVEEVPDKTETPAHTRVSAYSLGKADDGTRTHDTWLGKPVLYQLSYVREAPSFSRVRRFGPPVMPDSCPKRTSLASSRGRECVCARTLRDPLCPGRLSRRRQRGTSRSRSRS